MTLTRRQASLREGAIDSLRGVLNESEWGGGATVEDGYAPLFYQLVGPLGLVIQTADEWDRADLDAMTEEEAREKFMDVPAVALNIALALLHAVELISDACIDGDWEPA